MLTSLHIRNLRGIQKLDAEGLGRVNLVIGRNEAGKTTFLAAAGMQDGPFGWGHIVPYLDDPRPEALELERHWLPLFRGADTKIPVHIWADLEGGKSAGWRMELSRQKGRALWPALFTAVPGNGKTTSYFDDGTAIRTRESEVTIQAENTSLAETNSLYWLPAFVESESKILPNLLELYLEGRISEVLPPLRQVNPNIESVEIAGNYIYVRLRSFALPLRLGVLGDGARRILELAIAIAKPGRILIDELENGFHYSTLPLVLSMLQSAPPDRQIFATTHRDELIRTACELFLERGDDGLRIIRLDRGESEHRAVIYTAAQALAGMESGLELRG